MVSPGHSAEHRNEIKIIYILSRVSVETEIVNWKTSKIELDHFPFGERHIVWQVVTTVDQLKVNWDVVLSAHIKAHSISIRLSFVCKKEPVI